MDRARDVAERHLPAALVGAITPEERWWRGRTVLVLWIQGLSLRLAWTYAMDDDPDQCRFYRDMMATLDDRRLLADLESTSELRAERATWP